MKRSNTALIAFYLLIFDLLWLYNKSFDTVNLLIDASMKSCKIDNSGYWHFFECAGAPPNTLQVIFDSLLFTLFYTLSDNDDIVHFSLREIPGILSEEIQVNDLFLESCSFEDTDGVFSASNFIRLISNVF